MYCLTNMCYVCLEGKDKSLININSSLSVNEDIIHIIGYLPCNLGWLKTKRILLICEECCRRLRETYQMLAMCHKNSAVLQSYMDQLSTASISNTDNQAELCVNLNSEQDDIIKIKCEIISEDEAIYTFESGPIIEESEEVFMNVDDGFVKEEDTWKREAVDDEEEPPMENNSTERSDNETDTQLSVNSDTHDTDTDSDSSGFTSTQGQTTNMKELNTAAKKVDDEEELPMENNTTESSDTEIAVNSNTHDTDTDSDSSGFISTQVHTTNKKKLNTTAKKTHKCLTCSKSFSTKANLERHIHVHTGEKPYECSRCKKCFTTREYLVSHMRIHTGEKPYECATCKKCFNIYGNLVRHMRTHTGEKPYECATCKKCFSTQGNLVRHMRTHTGEKPYDCATCKKCFNRQGSLVRHMRTHTGDKF